MSTITGTRARRAPADGTLPPGWRLAKAPGDPTGTPRPELLGGRRVCPARSSTPPTSNRSTAKRIGASGRRPAAGPPPALPDGRRWRTATASASGRMHLPDGVAAAGRTASCHVDPEQVGLGERHGSPRRSCQGRARRRSHPVAGRAGRSRLPARGSETGSPGLTASAGAALLPMSSPVRFADQDRERDLERQIAVPWLEGEDGGRECRRGRPRRGAERPAVRG